MKPLLAAILAAGLAACAADDAGLSDPCDPDPEVIEPRGLHSHYVVDFIDIPNDSEEVQALGLDLDGDDRVDNQLGSVLAAVLGLLPEYDLDAEAAALIDDGTITHLFDLQAVDLVNALDVGLEVLHGRDLDGDTADNFSGAEPFGLDLTRGSGELVGVVESGRIDAARGEVPVAFTFPGLGEAFVVPLAHARIVATVDEDGMSGVITGGMSQQVIDEVFVPALHRGFDNIIRRDCDETSCSSEFAQLLLDVFDQTDPPDRQLDLEELRNNSLLRVLLETDVDLENEAGSYAPHCDDEDDHLSVGLGFTAVPARIQR